MPVQPSWSFLFWKFEQQGACNFSFWSGGSFAHIWHDLLDVWVIIIWLWWDASPPPPPIPHLLEEEKNCSPYLHKIRETFCISDSKCNNFPCPPPPIPDPLPLGRFTPSISPQVPLPAREGLCAREVRFALISYFYYRPNLSSSISWPIITRLDPPPPPAGKNTVSHSVFTVCSHSRLCEHNVDYHRVFT